MDGRFLCLCAKPLPPLIGLFENHSNQSMCLATEKGERKKKKDGKVETVKLLIRWGGDIDGSLGSVVVFF